SSYGYGYWGGGTLPPPRPVPAPPAGGPNIGPNGFPIIAPPGSPRSVPPPIGSNGVPIIAPLPPVAAPRKPCGRTAPPDSVYVQEVAMTRKILASCALAVLAFVTVPLAAEDKPIERLRAFAVNMNGGPRTNAGTVDIGITRWSTEAERDALLNTLKEKGSTALLDALTKQP